MPTANHHRSATSTPFATNKIREMRLPKMAKKALSSPSPIIDAATPFTTLKEALPKRNKRDRKSDTELTELAMNAAMKVARRQLASVP
jgi:hypothetical protein